MKHTMKKLLLVAIMLQLGGMFTIAQNEQDEIMSKYSDLFEWVIKPKYNGIKDIPEANILTFSDKKGKLGYMTLQEEILVPCEWGVASVVDAYGFGRVAKNAGHWSYYFDVEGTGKNAFGEMKFQHAYPFNCKYALVGTSGVPMYAIIDTTGKVVLPFVVGVIKEPSNLEDIMDGKSVDWIPALEYKSSGMGALSGYINNKAEWVLHPSKYVVTFPRSGDFYPVRTHQFRQTGLLDLEGKLVVPCEYLDLKGMTDPLIQAMRKSGWGLVDKSGKEVVACEYDFISHFDDAGKAYFEKGNQYGYIYTEGIKVEVKGSLDRLPVKQVIGNLNDGKLIIISYEDKNKKNTFGIAKFADDKVNVKIEPSYSYVYINYHIKPFIVVANEAGTRKCYGMYDHELNLLIDPALREFYNIGIPNSDGYMSVAVKDKYGVAKVKQ